MNKQQKEMLQASLNSEKEALKKLTENYQDALFEIDDRLERLLARQDADMQHVIYQVEYQKALKTQIQAILEQLQNNNFETLSEYLTASYEEGFLGTMYDLQAQGIPLVFPIDQEQVVAAIQHETKLSEDLYSALGKDTKRLSKQIAGEISRGISNGAMYSEMARNIESFSNIPKNNAMRIARTEAHRIQNKAISNAQWKAKEKGADIVKIWSAALDGKTRDTHRALDGQIRELDEPFEVAGMEAMEPGGFGVASEDCNCRCRCNSKARWLLDTPFTKWSEDAPVLIDDDGTTQLLQFDNMKDYDDFKKKYWKAIDDGSVRPSVQKMTVNAPYIKDKVIGKAYDDFNTVLMNSDGNEMMVNRLIMASDTVDFVEDNALKTAFSYIPDEDIIKYNSKIPNFELYDMNYVQAHELSHRIDMKELHSWDNDRFVSAIEESRQIVNNNTELIAKWFEDGGKYADDVAMSDIISALSNADMNDKLIAGHSKEYWQMDQKNVSLEVLANIASIDIIGNASKIELETMFKDLFNAYMEMVG